MAALAVGSGAAALTYAFQAVAHAGDHIVAAKNIYGGTYNLLAHTLPDYGIEATFVDPFDYDGIKAAIKENTKAIEIETLGNPNSEVVDIERIANIAHEAGIPLIVDNTFATPYLVRPIEYGADIVVHSATKFIGGHGTTIGGVIIDSGKFDWTQNDKWPWLVEPNVSYHGVSFAKDCAPAAFATYIRAILLRDTGATISPVHSFIFLQGLETLSLRVERHVENALSDKAGVVAGDRIVRINDSLVAGQQIAQREIMRRLRGKRGSEVRLGLERRGIDELVEVTVVRDKIPIRSLTAALMLTGDIAFVKLDQFARTSHTELLEALSTLRTQGMRKLILDLRGNSGGFLDQAIAIANEFLPADKLIVYTEDRNHQRIEQYSDGTGSAADRKSVV